MRQTRSCLEFPRQEAATAASARRRAGFSLVELLMVIGIIALLVSIIIPTVAKARESAVRVQCASNLRQCGMADRMYANDNDGWLLLRLQGYQAEVDVICPPGGSLMSVPLTKYAPASIWFCPSFNTRVYGRQPWSDQEKAAAVAVHRIGYAVFGAHWNASQGVPVYSSPHYYSHNIILHGEAFKVNHLRSSLMRMSEFYVVGNLGYNDKPTVFHHRRKTAKWDNATPRPDGGNMLMGDGSVQWTTGMFKDFGNNDVPVFAAPEFYNNFP